MTLLVSTKPWTSIKFPVLHFDDRSYRFYAKYICSNEFTEDQVLLTGWEEDVANIAEKIIEEQSPRQLYIIRGKFQNLIDHNVSPDFIFTSLVGELKKRLSKEFHSKIDAFFLEYKMDIGGVLDGEKSSILLHSRYKESKGKGNIDLGKDVQHFMMIEEFTAKFMSYYKAYTKNKNLKLKEKL
ncbi:probable replication factor C subunit 3 [Papaver somniferum]|uniref:probable replication factor C subunit 3 n=1 Tax=Papaver somniferum TaxID=3469 RepID=UPI000E702B38|nr:probable replication factor C subunit 3 [Papaver somniferum]